MAVVQEGVSLVNLWPMKKAAAVATEHGAEDLARKPPHMANFPPGDVMVDVKSGCLGDHE